MPASTHLIQNSDRFFYQHFSVKYYPCHPNYWKYSTKKEDFSKEDIRQKLNQQNIE